MEKKELIILCSYSSYVDCFNDMISHYEAPYSDYTYHLILTVPTEKRNINDIFEECCTLIEQRHICGVISTGCWNSLIHAALHEKYQHIKGASFESEFLAMHKLYFRQVIDCQLPEGSTAFGYWNVENGRMDVSNIGENKSIIAKPYLGTASADITITENQDQLYKIKKDPSFLKLKLAESSKQFIERELKHINREHYIVDTGYVLEEYFDGVKQPMSFHTVDFAVSKKKIVKWAISENNYWSHRPVCFLGVGVPSRLAADVQNRAWTLMDDLMDILLKYGYDNQFIDAELIVFNDGRMKIMEINGRMFGQAVPVYNQVLENGDCLKAATDLSLGNPLKSPDLKPGTYGLNAYLNVFTSGRAGDLLDFSEAQKIKEICLYVSEDNIIKHDKRSETGQKLGYVYTSGISFEDCVIKTRDIIGKVISVEAKKACPWFEDVNLQNSG